MRDFGSFIASGNAARLGLNPYSEDYPDIFIVDLPKLGMKVKAVNLNPPVLLPFFELLGLVDSQLSFRFWQVISIVVYLIGLVLLFKEYKSYRNITLGLWSLGLAGFWHTIELGQIYIPLFALSIIIWILLKRGYQAWAGILIGVLIAIKPNFLLWAICLLLAGHISAGVSAFISFIVLWILPILRYGTTIYQHWYSAMQNFDGYALPANNSLVGLTSRFGSITAGTITSFILIMIVLILIWRKRPAWEMVCGLGILVSLLASPTAWSGYTLFLLPLFMTRKWTIPWKIGAVLFAVPFPLVFSLTQFNKVNFVVFGWFYGWAMLLLLFILGWETVYGERAKTTTSVFSNANE